MEIKNYEIKNVKHYQTIGSIVDGLTFIIPSKGKKKTFSAKIIPKDILKLKKDGIIELKEIKK